MNVRVDQKLRQSIYFLHPPAVTPKNEQDYARCLDRLGCSLLRGGPDW